MPNTDHITPPKSAERFLGWFLKGELLEEILGDLYEYHEELLDKPSWKRKLFYWFHVLHFLRPFALKKIEGQTQLNNFGMLKNYFKIGYRNLLRSKEYSVINILGLTVGIATSIFIFLWITHEWSFDKFHEKSDRIFSVLINNTYPDGKIETYPATPAKLADAISNDIPEVELVAQYSFETELLINNEGAGYYETGIYADPALFSIFSFPIIKGNISNVNTDLKSIAISQGMAEKIFPQQNPIGKTLLIGQTNELKITSVFANIPSNSSLQFDFVIPFDLFEKENAWTQNWKSGGLRTVVLLRSNKDKANRAISELIQKNCADCTTTPFLFPFQKSRLYTDFENGINSGGRIQQMVLLGVVALLILLMSCINFMNLSTANSTIRGREVGLRKSMGAQKSQLIVQFIIESMLTSFIALLFALVIIQLLLPFLNGITGKSIQLDLTEPFLIAGCLSITVICGLLAGSYPSFILSSFNPVKVLKGDNQSILTGKRLRQTLVVFQFVTSLVLVIGSLVVYDQLTFITNRNLGFDKDNIIVLEQNKGITSNYQAIKNDLKQLPFVKHIAFGGNNIFTIPITTTDPVWNGKPTNANINFKVYRCDADFIPTLNIKLLSGRNFIGNKDTSNYLINKKAAEMMGLDLENAVGSVLEMWNGKGRIIGITDDFHNSNLRFGIEPLIFMYSENVGAHYFIKLSGQLSYHDQIGQIAEVFARHNPEYPFEANLIDDVFYQEYQTELVMGKLSVIFTFIAVLISCLGLFGLAAFSAKQRTKEMGVRKVLGASVMHLWGMLSREFVVLIVISSLIALPVAYYFGSSWLQGYEYRTDLNLWIFVTTGVGAMVITLVTVSFHAIKTSLSNPIDTLKNE